MKRISLVMCGCLFWTTVVNAQNLYSPSQYFQANGTGQPGAMDNQSTPPPPSSVFVERLADRKGFPTTITRKFSSGAPVAAGYEEYVKAPYEEAGVQSIDTAAAPATQSLDPFGSLTRTVDVSGLDLFGVMPFFSNLAYGSGSIKDRGYTSGFYGYASTTLDLVELGVDETLIKFRSGFRFHQYDYTVIWNNYNIENFRIRGGVHYIGNNDSRTNQGIIGILGGNYFKDGYEVGSDFYVTDYNNYGPSLTMTQISPHVVFPYGNGKAEVRGYYIHSNHDLGLGRRDFLSVEGRLSQDFGKFNVGSYVWGGNQTFAVRNDGFVVYNLNEEHRAGYGGEATYKFTDHTKLTIRAGQELFSDFTNRVATQQTVVTLLFLHTF